MCEIICQEPWHCGNIDGCKQGWHKRSYWTSPNEGFSCDEYSDGDHDDCLTEDLPTQDALAKSWASYWKHVVETGDDPLGEIAIPEETSKRKWEILLVRWIGCRLHGLKLVSARRGGRGPWVPVSRLPRELIEYCCTEERYNSLGSDLPDLESLQACDDVENARYEHGNNLRIRCNVTIEETKFWNPRKTKAYIRKIANTNLVSCNPKA